MRISIGLLRFFTATPRILSLTLMAVLLTIFAFGANLHAQTATVLHRFTGTGGDGYNPFAPLAIGPGGTLYGTTSVGGNLSCPGSSGQGCGTVFQEKNVNGFWIHSTIYAFDGGLQGILNYSTLAVDSAGRVYGVTDSGSPGIIFRLTPVAHGLPWHYSPLYQFQNQSDGEYPLTPLYFDKAGAIYGATADGSLSSCPNGCGAIFQVVPPAIKGGAWTENTLYQFTGGADGGTPDTFIMDRSGVIYGTTFYGATVNGECGSGCGTVFRLAPSQTGGWTFSVIYTFTGVPDGNPYGRLLEDGSGNLYGIAYKIQGGEEIFKLTPTQSGEWTKSIVYVPSDGVTSITLGSNGVLYGVETGDFDFDAGNVFQLTPKSGGGYTFNTLVNFNHGPDWGPQGVTWGLDGLYGTTSGGVMDGGTVFVLK
jgi:hypothetical protein